MNGQRLNLAKYQDRVKERWERWQKEKFSSRLWQKDPTLWFPKQTAEITDRLGWLTLPETMHEQIDDLKTFAEEVRAEGIRHVVLLGMGGSSLAPEVFQRTFGNQPGYPQLTVLDSTHPGAVQSLENRVNFHHTLFLVSSKSGTTTETLSFFRYFWHKLVTLTGKPGHHFVAITDPETPLATLARDRAFRSVFKAPADVGGRYSALTVFGLLPATLIGLDVPRLLDRARTMIEASAFSMPDAYNQPLLLGAALGEFGSAGRDKVAFVASPSLAAFPAWLEQLIAESTGKDGKGIIPVIDEPPAAPEAYPADRAFIRLRLEGDDNDQIDRYMAAVEANGHPVVWIDLRDKYDLGQEFFRWEVAVAAAGAALGIHPFNQPDVELAKELARKAMAKGTTEPGDQDAVKATVEPERDLAQATTALFSGARRGDYFALQAYLEPTPETTSALQEIRLAARNQLHVATTLGYGPRFLHSTGQLHKGGPNNGLFLQIIDEPGNDLPVPEADYTFGGLLRAQAIGDYQALRQCGRRVLRVNLGSDVTGGLQQLANVLRG